MTSRQKKFVCWLSSGRRVMAVGNISAKNPKLMFGEIDTDPRQLKQPDLDDFLRWWGELEKQHSIAGVQLQLRFAKGFGVSWPLPKKAPKTDTPPP